ncbi:hypothetical protein UA08_01112 [Talaromyces atroroseus]|uniref:Uncharacterized protein n=1 Tax=Talaromyces atroroseus TaxID=1441469 RepID=A0A225ASC8_TALAT|nr:hypothetical protein UA08_01112 [Talaromyces atroroseus]OKL63900.1 hypothetical protein UA08_01112 [Talaromyces atroroseus]
MPFSILFEFILSTTSLTSTTVRNERCSCSLMALVCLMILAYIAFKKALGISSSGKDKLRDRKWIREWQAESQNRIGLCSARDISSGRDGQSPEAAAAAAATPPPPPPPPAISPLPLGVAAG